MVGEIRVMEGWMMDQCQQETGRWKGGSEGVYYYYDNHYIIETCTPFPLVKKPF